MNDQSLNDQPKFINIEKAYERRHWARELDWSEADLCRAVQKVGSGLVELRALRRLSGPSFRSVFTVRTPSASYPELHIRHFVEGHGRDSHQQPSA